MKTIPQGISIVYFNEPQKTIHAKLPVDKEQAKRLSKRIYKDAMVTISAEKLSCETLVI